MFRKSIFLVFIFCSYSFVAYAASTTLTQTIQSGALQITAPVGNTSLTSGTVKSTSQTLTGTVGGILIEDNRGTGAGWTAVVTSGNLTYTNLPRETIANTSPLISINSTSFYNGSCGAQVPFVSYIVTISAGGSVGAATYSVTGGCTGEELQTNVVSSATSNAVGSRGVLIDFPTGTYVQNDSWSIGVDTLPYSDLTITPQTPTEYVAGSGLGGLTTGTSGLFTGSGAVSSARTILSASTNNGMGSYSQDLGLSLFVHSNTYSGAYLGTLTFSIS